MKFLLVLIAFLGASFNGLMAQEQDHSSQVSLSGNRHNNRSELQWQLPEGSNTSSFIIERSFDGRNFTELGRQRANAKNNNYIFSDSIAHMGKILYRLQLVDNDGHSSYSSTIVLSAGGMVTSITVFPNPAQDLLSIQVNDLQLLGTQARLLDMNGKLAASVQLGKVIETIDMSKLTAGIYFVHLENGEQVKVLKASR
jgi:hypothetical protein